MTHSPSSTALAAALRQRWSALQPRERLLCGGAALLVGLLLLWNLALAPALSTLRVAPPQREELDGQLRLMRRLAAEADTLRVPGAAPAAEVDARAALSGVTRQMLGERAKVVDGGEQLGVTLEQVPAGLLLDWLARVRDAAHLRPGQAGLSAAEGGLWSGTLVFELPSAKVSP